MDLDLGGAAVLVTGGASGIGAAVVRALVAEGAAPALLDADAAAAHALAERLRADGARAVAVPADVTDEAAVAGAVAGAARALGGIDAVVCCAGVSGQVGTALADVDLADVARVMAVNVTGTVVVLKHADPHLRASTRWPLASVVLLASDSALVAAPGMVAYTASKGAVLSLVRSLSVELAGAARVNCVCPSVVDTPMARGDLGEAALDAEGGPGFPVQQGADVARLVLHLLSPASAPVNGTSLVSDFGVMARSGFPA